MYQTKALSFSFFIYLTKLGINIGSLSDTIDKDQQSNDLGITKLKPSSFNLEIEIILYQGQVYIKIWEFAQTPKIQV